MKENCFMQSWIRMLKSSCIPKNKLKSQFPINAHIWEKCNRTVEVAAKQKTQISSFELYLHWFYDPCGTIHCVTLIRKALLHIMFAAIYHCNCVEKAPQATLVPIVVTPDLSSSRIMSTEYHKWLRHWSHPWLHYHAQTLHPCLGTHCHCQV